jgi:hypothetical protein
MFDALLKPGSRPPTAGRLAGCKLALWLDAAATAALLSSAGCAAQIQGPLLCWFFMGWL